MLGVDPIKHARKGDTFPDMLNSRQPADRSLDAKAEASVGNRPIAAQIQIPGKIFRVELMFIDSAQ